MNVSLNDPVVDVSDLSRTFNQRIVLDRISLRLQRGTVLGLVGVNGAGKTTLIKHILGLLTPQSGYVRIFGKNPIADPVGVLSRIGHLSENCDLPDWMRIRELLGYTGSFYPTWDADYAVALCKQFGLDLAWRVNALSRGLRVRAGLVVALAHRPDLLVLDEPSAGLDPLARMDILTAVIRAAASEGTTVLFSSHLLDEVERVADQIALLDAGRLLFCGELDTIRDRHRRLTLRFSEPRTTPPALAGVLHWEGNGREWSAVCDGELDQLMRAAADAGGQVIDETKARLDEVIVAHAVTARTTRGN